MITRGLLVAIVVLTISCPAWCQVRYAPPLPGEVRSRVFAWIDEQKVDPAVRTRIEALWQEQSSGAMDAQAVSELAIESWCLAAPAIAAVMQPFRSDSGE